MDKLSLWCRVGVSVEVCTEEDVKRLQDNPSAYIEESLANGKAEFNGDSYFPDTWDDNERFEEKHGDLPYWQ